jgi:hypothetical protein
MNDRTVENVSLSASPETVGESFSSAAEYDLIGVDRTSHCS